MSILGLRVFGAMSYLKSKKPLTTQGSTGRRVVFVLGYPSSMAFFQPTFLSPLKLEVEGLPTCLVLPVSSVFLFLPSF